MSRAAVLASILPADADREKFVHALGIHGDPIKTQRLIMQALRMGERYKDGYGYERAFKYVLKQDDVGWLNNMLGTPMRDIVVVDPTAGGGSIPFEAVKIGSNVFANDLNPVAVLVMLATIKWPILYKKDLEDEFVQLALSCLAKMREKLAVYFPCGQSRDNIPITFLWARTIPCPYCSGLVPLSPNWRIAPDGTGVALKPDMSNGPGSDERVCSFQIVGSVREQSEGTVSKGDGLCPYPDCGRVISGAEIKAAAKAGDMGEQMYAVVYKERITTRTKTGRSREKWVKGYRGPKPEDYNSKFVKARLEEKMQEWDANDIIPTEKFPYGSDNRPIEYGMPYWRDLFSPRQLLCHGTSVEVFRELLDEDKQNDALTDIHKAAYAYLAIALDTIDKLQFTLDNQHGTVHQIDGLSGRFICPA